MGILTDPTRPHVDIWEVVLAVITLGSASAAWWEHRQLHRKWRHHPYRVDVELQIVHAVTSTAVFMVIATVAHGAGWEAWGTPAFALVGITLLVAAGIIWRWSFRPLLRRFDARSPKYAAPRAKLPPANPQRIQYPMFVALASGLAGYFIFTTHTFSHIFHMGMWLASPPVGYAIASLVAALTLDHVRLTRSISLVRSPRAGDQIDEHRTDRKRR